MFFDPLYFVFALPALALGLWAQSKVKSNFRKYSQVGNLGRLTGAEAARRILDSQGLYEVQVEESRGFLSDHYNPRGKTLRLSRDVYHNQSIAAVGIAAHEAGHAVQDQTNYALLGFRTAIVPTVQLGSWLGPIMFIIGILVTPTLAWIGLAFFALTSVFTLVTLPVEFNASHRAKQLLVTQNILIQQELEGVNKVLDAAALTYVAATLQSLSTLAYYAFLLTGISRD
jgi:Zn-dependent membrane protease YugP